MAVESRFVVIRKGVEVQTFMDKKAADEYDKMLDMADSLSEMFESSSLTLDESMTEELSIYLAQHREDVLIALQAKKPKPAVAGIKKAESRKENVAESLEENVVSENLEENKEENKEANKEENKEATEVKAKPKSQAKPKPKAKPKTKAKVD